MIDPKLNKLPVDKRTDVDDVPESELSPEERAAGARRPRPGLSIKDTVAGDTVLSVGAPGVNTSGVASGAGAGAGLTSTMPGERGESPAPNIVPGARSAGTTPLGAAGVDRTPTTRLNAGAGQTAERGESPAPNIVPGARSAGTTLLGAAGVDQTPTTRLDAGTGPTTDEIAARAYRCWHERGCPEGSPEVDWCRAEEELRREREQQGRSAVASA